MFLCALLAVVVPLIGAAPALAAPPVVKSVSSSQVTTTSATLKATIDPNGVKTPVYHFQYVTLAQFEASGFAGAAETPDGPPLAPGAGPTPIAAEITGLEPATAYRFRIFAENTKGEKTESPPLGFATYALPLLGLPDGRAYEQASPLEKNGADVTSTVSFAKAAADGGAVSFGDVSGLPGGEGAQAVPFLTLASRLGEGAGVSWASHGLLPPAATAQAGAILGWTPDFSRVYQKATQFGAGGLTSALLERPGPGGPVTQITPFLLKADYAFAGSSADGSEAVFETKSAQLGTTPAGVEGRSNVYAWDADNETLSLVSRLNTPEETEAALSTGAFAGPYDWARARTGEGGAKSLYYTRDTHAVAADGSVFFTAAGSGHLYERLNPTQPQSAMSGGECTEPANACTIDVSASQRSTPDAGGPQPAAFHYASADGSAALFTSSEKLTDDANTGPEIPPPAIGRLTLDGEENAEEELDNYFPGAHALGVAVNGNHIYWVDPTKGTIARATMSGSGTPTDVRPSYIDVAAEETCFETRPFKEPGVEQCAPSTPRYVAVQGEYVYWTNTGPLGGEGNGGVPIRGAGTIGRAKINPVSEEAEEIDPAFIRGEEVGPHEFLGPSDPQGIAVNSEHIYWANSLRTEGFAERFIARAGINGDDVEEHFFDAEPFNVFGIALSPTRIYYAVEPKGDGYNGIHTIPLEGGVASQHTVGRFLETRGVAVAGSHVYWTDQATGAIGRVSLADLEPSRSECSEMASCEPEFIKPGGALLGLAADASGSHLYWSANGESPPHPGNDLYRFRRQGTGGCAQAPGCLTDLAPLQPRAGEEDGPEVLGVAGAAADASRVYFVANAVLTEAPNESGEVATRGDCRGEFTSITGRCNLYLWDGGDIRFIAPLEAAPGGSSGVGDSSNWVPSIRNGVYGGGQAGTQKSAFASASGAALLFRSQGKLTSYENEGTAELYLYRLGEGITCVSCDPSGAPPSGPATLGTIKPPLLAAEDTTALASRNLSADGRRTFFESPDPLVATDTNGSLGCPRVGSTTNQFPACLDVYEWEAPGEGSCEEGAPAYSPASGGCIYLISSGKSSYPSIFLDASESGSDAFFFTRSQLVGQDTDTLVDVYDARVGGGIAAQNPPPPTECEGEACKPEPTQPPGVGSPATPSFQGEGNVQEKPPKPCPKGKVRRHGKCVKKHKPHHHRKHNRAQRDQGGRR